MRVFVILLMIFGSNCANLISDDEIQKLFTKYLKNEMSNYDHKLFEEVTEILHRPEHVSAKALEFNSQLRMTIDCVICRSVFASAFEVVREGQSSQELAEVIITLCTLLGIESYAVCTGAVKLNLPIIHYIILNSEEATPGAMCNLVLQSATNQNVCPFNDARFEWQVELPPKPTTIPAPIGDNKPLTAVVLTDFHIDPLYEAGGVADCDEPTCCRKGQTPSRNYVYKSNIDESLLARSIVNDSGTLKLELDEVANIRKMRSEERTRFPKARSSPPAGYWGDYRDCDSPIWAFDDAIDRITETHKDIDVVYYIGDTIDHFVWETTYEMINDVNRYVMEKMRKSFGENTIILPTIGNHESQPTNQFAPDYVKGEYINTTWLYEALAEKWGHYLPKDGIETFKKRGDYSILVRPGLRVIAINTNVAYKYNWWLVYDPLDAKKHLDWLVEELYKAEQSGESVHILTHIPPGVHDLTHTWTREYNRIVNRFSNTIKAEFNGHTHSDEFKIFYSETDGSPINVAWGGGSVTTYSFYNLNYKIVKFDGGTYAPQSIENYVYNLTEANLTPNRRPHWFKLYDMKNTFGLTDLSANSLDNLTKRMVTTNLELLDIYAAFFSKLSDYRWSWCGEGCKLDNLCKTVVTVLWERDRCEALRNLYFNNKKKAKN